MFAFRSSACLASVATAMVGVMGLAPLPAHALVVNVGGTDYDINTVLGTFAANEPLLTSQLWWNDGPLAIQFANALNNQLGLPNAGIWSPFFSFQKSPETDIAYNPQFTTQAKTWQDNISSVVEISTPAGTFESNPFIWQYATATRVPTVPGPLPIFGAVAAFGVSRRLRKRIQAAK